MNQHTKNKHPLTQSDAIDLQEDVEKVKQAFLKAAHDVRERAEEILYRSLQDVKTRSENLEECVVSYVKTNPVKTIAYSVLAGIIVSKLIK